MPIFGHLEALYLPECSLSVCKAVYIYVHVKFCEENVILRAPCMDFIYKS